MKSHRIYRKHTTDKYPKKRRRRSSGSSRDRQAEELRRKIAETKARIAQAQRK